MLRVAYGCCWSSSKALGGPGNDGPLWQETRDRTDGVARQACTAERLDESTSIRGIGQMSDGAIRKHLLQRGAQRLPGSLAVEDRQQNCVHGRARIS